MDKTLKIWYTHDWNVIIKETKVQDQKQDDTEETKSASDDHPDHGDDEKATDECEQLACRLDNNIVADMVSVQWIGVVIVFIL